MPVVSASLRIHCLSALLFILVSGFCNVLWAAPPQIPSLKWEKRSDWVSVKSDITPAAIGDGIADDTKAIQKALDAMKQGSVVYLPPGTYRITNTLVNRHTDRLLGIALIGHGRDTKIIWDGNPGGRMLSDAGASYSRYVGLLFDGRGKAAVGLYHQNGSSSFETEVRHQHLAFLNFTDTGILVEGSPATAEVITENCLFEHCGRGIACLSFNDYDYTIDGCEFRRCETAIECRHGNAYVRNCHFEASSSVDILLKPEHGSSVRRCTSVGSKSFIVFDNDVSPVTIQDCRVAGWTNVDGAIMISGAPVMLFDCVFTNPPGKKPPVNVQGLGQRLFVSGNISAMTDAVLPFGLLHRVYDIPQGKRAGSIVSASQSFLKERVAIPTVVFDAKRDFGARGNGSGDDSAPIQKAIDAARTHGKGAIAYLPTGVYAVKSTLRITGSNYSVGGSGFRSGLLWKGAAGDAILTVHDPNNVVLENMAIGNHDTGMPMNNGIDILQTSSGKPSKMTYDNISVYGMYQREPFRKGLWLKELGKEATVLMPDVQGNIRVVDSAQATILLNNTYEGALVIEGKDKRRTGFLGALSRLGTSCTYALYIKNNHSFVASDFFVEQADNGFSFGGSYADPPGRITIQGPKLHLKSSTSGNLAFDINDYSGQIFVGPQQYYVEPETMLLRHKGHRPLDLVLFASCFYKTKLKVQKDDSSRLQMIGNTAVGGELLSTLAKDELSSGVLQSLAAALDDLRLLGELDLRLNHSRRES